MRHSFRTESLFNLEDDFLENDILLFYKNQYKALSKMLTTTKTNIIIIKNKNSKNYSTKTTHTGQQIDAYEHIDGQNNSVTKERMDNTLITARIWYPI